MSVTTFLETPFAGPFGNWWCLPCWCLGGLSILFRWSLVSLWWCVRSVLTVSGDFGSCCGVLAVFRGCLVGIEGMVFSCFFPTKLRRTLLHTIFHTPSCHTPSFIHHLVTHNFVTHHFHTHTDNFVTHHLSHTSLSHTTLSYTTLSHTIFHTHTHLCHTPSFTQHCHTPFLSHAVFHTQLCHTPALPHTSVHMQLFN